jgi:hypothetical protein
MGNRWPSREIIGVAARIFIIISATIGAMVIAQSLGASGRLLMMIGGVASLVVILAAILAANKVLK